MSLIKSSYQLRPSRISSYQKYHVPVRRARADMISSPIENAVENYLKARGYEPSDIHGEAYY